MTTPASLEQQYTLATAVARYDELRMLDLIAPGVGDRPQKSSPGHCHGKRPWNRPPSAR
jgi:hypothetical protein